MIVKTMLADADGDIPVSSENTGTPFKISPVETHPFLTLGDYFQAVEVFLLKDKAKRLRAAIYDLRQVRVDPEDIDKILIRSEKHGVLYHIASVEVFYMGFQTRLSVSTAISDRAKKWLLHEFKVITHLNKNLGLPYLPKVFSLGEVPCRSREGTETFMTLSLAEWFEDHHEWHFAEDDKEKGQRIRVWDLKRGCRFLSEKSKYDLFRQASRILTLYYDTRDFRQIYPWHHAAGDFTVKSEGGRTEVRLTTARRYEPVMAFPDDAATGPLVALTNFFLNLTIKMRIDKIDGTGDVFWAGEDILPAVIKGFFQGIGKKEAKGTTHLGKGADFPALLKSFNRDEIEGLIMPLLDLYSKEDPADFSVIRENLSDHASQLFRALRDFHG